MTLSSLSIESYAESERFQLFVASVTDYALYMLNPEGRVCSWNAGAQRFKGCTAEEIIGQHFSRFYTEEDRAADIPFKALQTAINEEDSKMKAGAYARMAIGSEPASSLIQFGMARAR